VVLKGCDLVMFSGRFLVYPGSFVIKGLERVLRVHRRLPSEDLSTTIAILPSFVDFKDNKGETK
jgi:hypothetical protein